jgi:dihydroorotate dehydrogenase
VQLITGMIYEGPSVIGKINKDLSKLIKKDGYKNISEAIGAYHK